MDIDYIEDTIEPLLKVDVQSKNGIKMPPTSTETLTTQTRTEELLHLKSVKNVSDGKNSSKSQKLVSNDDIDIYSDYFPPLQIVWKNVGLFAYLHVFAAYGLYTLLTGQVMWQTLIISFITHLCGALGITAGAHRLWSHKSYKANRPLTLILTCMQTISFQNSIHEWSRDHRVHHKYSETHADPHNAKRGFFFAHMGWLMCRKHEAVKIKGKNIDLSDLEADPIIMFQKKYYVPLVLTFSFFVPALIPWYFWGESFIVSWCVAAQLRYCFNLHCTWLVNSAAHMWGSKPYDKTINPSENKFVSLFAFGEGWHNYHHTFPWDYKTAEVGRYKYNFTAAFIDFFAWIGWAYDLKTVPEKIVQQRVSRTGDGSYVDPHNHHHSHHNNIGPGPYGWGDKDIPEEDSAVTTTLYPSKKEE